MGGNQPLLVRFRDLRRLRTSARRSQGKWIGLETGVSSNARYEDVLRAPIWRSGADGRRMTQLIGGAAREAGKEHSAQPHQMRNNKQPELPLDQALNTAHHHCSAFMQVEVVALLAPSFTRLRLIRVFAVFLSQL